MVFCYFGKGLPQFFTIIVLVILGIVNGREAKCQVVKIMGPESLRSSPAPLISYGIWTSCSVSLSCGFLNN